MYSAYLYAYIPIEENVEIVWWRLLVSLALKHGTNGCHILLWSGKTCAVRLRRRRVIFTCTHARTQQDAEKTQNVFFLDFLRTLSLPSSTPRWLNRWVIRRKRVVIARREMLECETQKHVLFSQRNEGVCHLTKPYSSLMWRYVRFVVHRPAPAYPNIAWNPRIIALWGKHVSGGAPAFNRAANTKRKRLP